MQVTSAVFLKSCPDPSSLPTDHRPTIACLGRSNVGKSSLINSLTKQSGLSHVSSTPGRTALVNVFLINKDWYLIDLPGYGYAKRSKDTRVEFEERIFQYLQSRPTLVLVIIDSAIGPTPLDEELLGFLDTEALPYLVIANKIDKQSGNERRQTEKRLSERFPNIPVIYHSVKTEEGRTKILECIDHAAKTRNNRKTTSTSDER